MTVLTQRFNQFQQSFVPREKKAALRGSAPSPQQDMGRGTSWLLFYIRNKMENQRLRDCGSTIKKKKRNLDLDSEMLRTPNSGRFLL